MPLEVKPTYCKCHPETCACNPWSVMDGDRKILSFYHKSDADIYVLTNIIAEQNQMITDLLLKIGL